MTAIIRWELWQRRWSIMWWCIGIVAFIALNLAFYPSFKSQSAELNKALADIPDSAMALFSDTGDFMSPIGYLSSQVFYLMLPLLLGVLAISLGSSLIAKEEQSGTIELLLSRPISRSSLIAAKLAVLAIITATVSLAAAIVTAILSKIVSLEVGFKGILLASAVTYLLCLSLGLVAFMITTLGRARIASVGVTALYGLAGYIISSLTQAAEWLKWPAKVFPFTYYKPAEILENHYNWNNLLFIIGLGTLAIIVSLLAFRRRDVSN